MTETPPTKRRFWQIRLSTAIALMIVAGGLLGLDMDGSGWPMQCWPIDESVTVRRFCFDVLVHVGVLGAAGVAAHIWMEAAEGGP